MKATGKLALLFAIALPLPALALVNINTASLAELDAALPGVGPATAQSIIDHRPYTSTAQISRADGIGEPGSSSYEAVIGLITVGESTTESADNEPEEEEAEEESSVASSKSDKKSPLDTLAIVAAAAPAGAPIAFAAEAKDAAGDRPVLGIRYWWNFGDGATGTGAAPVHTYAYPGAYRVLVSATYQGEQAVARTTLAVPAAGVVLAAPGDGSVIIKNGLEAPLDIGGWMLADRAGAFILPVGTAVEKGESLRLAPAVIGFFASGGIRLLFPSGETAATGVAPQAPARKAPAAKPAAAPAQAPASMNAPLAAAAGLAAPSPGAAPWLPYAGLAAVLAAGGIGAFYAKRPVSSAAAPEFEIEEEQA